VRRDGQIITFYSFKGGVGRSMALANIAALLCKAKKSVLMVDWDLEAPGLHKFFSKVDGSLNDATAKTPGIVDFVHSTINAKLIDWKECIVKIKIPNSRTIDFISAGQTNTVDYVHRLQSLNWQQLYDEYNIGETFERLRDAWKDDYDYILLDSRTGVTDIGDVCTALLPDILVTVLVANEQSIDGTKHIIERARTVHGSLPRDRNKLLILPILGRDESYTEYVLSTEWRKRISGELSFTIKDWIPKNIEAQTYFQKVFVPYYSYWSFGENLPVIQRETEMENPASISAAYGRITSLIESRLDWSVLEHSANPAEIEHLRSKASLGEAKNVEYAAKAKRRNVFTIASVIAAVAGFAAAVWTGFGAYVRTEPPIQTTEANKPNMPEQVSSELAEAHANEERIQQQYDEMSKNDQQQITNLKSHLDELAKQNSDLLAALQKTRSDSHSRNWTKLLRSLGRRKSCHLKRSHLKNRPVILA
jgi:cellulose biosynthesis protein BcsQ